jgi:hypothetical protein
MAVLADADVVVADRDLAGIGPGRGVARLECEPENPVQRANVTGKDAGASGEGYRPTANGQERCG